MFRDIFTHLSLICLGRRGNTSLRISGFNLAILNINFDYRGSEIKEN